jgi:tetratricopeptide (TPR) repeat protein
MKRLAFAGIFLLACVARADVVVQTDGTRVEGKITRSGDGWTVTQADGKVIFIDPSKVASIEPGKSHSDAADAIDRLDSLRRTVDHMSDINQVITKYQLFISQNSDPTALQEANKDLATWHDRADRGLVKLGDKWITPQERESRRQVAQGETSAGADLVRQDRMDEAETQLVQAALDDPQNGQALFLLGVLYYNQGQLDRSQASFEAANAANPGDPATLNNLAVIASRHRLFLKTIDYYAQAMSVSQEYRPLLDNVAEALNAVPVVNQHAPVLAKAAKLFQQQDPILQQSQARMGYYRWGSTWVTSKQLDELKALQAQTQKQLDDLKKDNDDLQAQITKIDSDIDANNREARRVQMQYTFTDAYGNSTSYLASPGYTDLQNDTLKLQDEKKKLLAKQQDLQTQAKMVQNQMPRPPFTGVQLLIGVEAIPAPVSPVATPGPTAPATMPSTKPS